MKSFKNNKIKNVVFDIGNVLLEYRWEAYLDSFQFGPETNKILAEAVFKSDEWQMGDAGILNGDDWKQSFVNNAPDYKSEIEALLADLKNALPPMPYAKKWIRYMKEEGYRLYYLSNYSDGVYKVTKENLDFLQEMDGGIFSYIEKCVKPDPEIYKRLLSRYDLCPEETVFFDDLDANVKAAQEAGIQGILFTPEIADKILKGETI